MKGSEPQRLSRREHNGRYHNLTPAELDEHERVMGSQMSTWPDGLLAATVYTTRQIGLCGDVVACIVADWVRNGSREHWTEWSDRTSAIERRVARLRGVASPALWGNDSSAAFRDEAQPLIDAVVTHDVTN